MSLAVKVYEAFKDDEKKAKVLSEVIDELESRIAPLRDVATRGDLDVVKLALQKEIEQVRGEVEQVRLSLQKEIEGVRKEIESAKASTIKWVIGLLVLQTGVIVSVIALLR
ncbi:DUF1640 domain-containing protein [Candidatus Bipolaricaulota bacterium]|nr:DUF1640 domain-containing protein [Candidatus Bipolaricaulota bacterium]